jgi:hypothetical protein
MKRLEVVDTIKRQKNGVQRLEVPNTHAKKKAKEA